MWVRLPLRKVNQHPDNNWWSKRSSTFHFVYSKFWLTFGPSFVIIQIRGMVLTME